MSSKPGAFSPSGISLSDALILDRRRPAYRGRESDTGFYAELQEPVAVMTREQAKREKAVRSEYQRTELGRIGPYER
jgi:hypothetical protein